MSSGATTTISAVTPCRTAFRRDRRLPASVFGPVLLSALLRLASICRNEVISLSSHRQFCRRSSPHRCLDQGSRRLGLAGTLACDCRPKLGASTDRDGPAIDPRVLP